MKKVVIIGAKGFIGKHLEWYLKTKLHIVPECYDVIDDNSPHYHNVDMTNCESVATINFDVDYIFYMVGMTGTKVGFDKYAQFVNINEISFLNLLDAIRKSKFRPKIVFPSSRLIYGGADKKLKECDEKDTKTIYAVNKLACESYLKVYNYNFDIPYTIFRICVPYGNMLDNNYSFGTVGFFIKMATSGKDIPLYGGGAIKRTFSHIEDICYQMIYGAFTHASDNHTYNIGGETCSLHDVARLVAQKYGVNVITTPWPEDDLRLESSHTYFDDTEIQKLLDGFKYLHSLVELR